MPLAVERQVIPPPQPPKGRRREEEEDLEQKREQEEMPKPKLTKRTEGGLRVASVVESQSHQWPLTVEPYLSVHPKTTRIASASRLNPVKGYR